MTRIRNMAEMTYRLLVTFIILATILNGVLAQGCNRTYTYSSGKITSPMYPDNYTDNLDCFFTIQAPKRRSIDIAFQSLYTEACCDWVQIRCSVGSSQTSPRLSGLNKPPFMTFDSCSLLTVHFHSNARVTNQGFSLNYTFGQGIIGGLIKRPRDVIFRQNPIVLQCASNGVQSNRLPWWSYSAPGDIFTVLTDDNCSLVDKPLGAFFSTQRATSNGSCNLIIQPNSTDSRDVIFYLFTCADSTLDTASVLVALSEIAMPSFWTDKDLNSSMFEVVKDDKFSLTCNLSWRQFSSGRYKYRRGLQIQSWVHFSSSKGRIMLEDKSYEGDYTLNKSLSLSVTAQPAILPSYTCNIGVKLAAVFSSNRAISGQQNLSFSTKSHPVLFWPEESQMAIIGDINGTMNVGESLACHVPANPPATVSWRDEKENDSGIAKGPIMYVSHSGAYTCIATNNIRGRIYRASKTVTITVTADALPKDVVLTLIVGCVLGAAVLILLLIVIILYKHRKFSQASFIKRILDASANNEGRIRNQYDVAEEAYVNQSELETFSGQGPSCSFNKNRKDSEIY